MYSLGPDHAELLLYYNFLIPEHQLFTMDLTHILERTCSKSDCRFHAAVFTAANKGRMEKFWIIEMITKGVLDRVLHSIPYGTQNVDGSGDAVTERSMFWCASMTKIVTAVAVMVAVEKGLVGLDDDVGAILPELAEPDIIVGFEDGNDGMFIHLHRRIYQTDRAGRETHSS